MTEKTANVKKLAVDIQNKLITNTLTLMKVRAYNMGGVIIIMKEHLEYLKLNSNEKTCIKCELTLPLTDFSKKLMKNGRQKYMPYCKECDLLRQREQRNGKFKEFYNDPDLDASIHCKGCFFYENRTTNWWFGKCYSLCIKKA